MVAVAVLTRRRMAVTADRTEGEPPPRGDLSSVCCESLPGGGGGGKCTLGWPAFDFDATTAMPPLIVVSDTLCGDLIVVAAAGAVGCGPIAEMEEDAGAASATMAPRSTMRSPTMPSASVRYSSLLEEGWAAGRQAQNNDLPEEASESDQALFRIDSRVNDDSEAKPIDNAVHSQCC